MAGMDPADDRAAKLIALNHDLLALAEELRASTRGSIERAADAVQSVRQIRLAWSSERQRLAAARAVLHRPQSDLPRSVQHGGPTPVKNANGR